jgi:predicted dienelactone hydrolase
MNRLIVALAVAVMALPSAGKAQDEAALGAQSGVAVQQATADDPGHASIPLVIWAPVTGTNLPLVVISHGTGAGPLSHVDTAQALAAAGFVVVAPMHPGDNFQDQSIVGRPAWFTDRSRQITKTVDYMLGQWSGRDRIAPKGIGIFGFSAGATTALIAIGGQPDLGLVTKHCATAPEFVCKIMAPSDADVKPQFTHDARITAAVIAAPGLGFAFAPNGLKDVKAPVQLWSGDADDTVPYVSNTGIVRQLLPHAHDFHNVPDGVHLSFLAPCTVETPPFLCEDKAGFDRSAFHAKLNHTIIEFFRAKLVPKN